MIERISGRPAIERELLSNKEKLSQDRPTVIKIGSAKDAGKAVSHIGFLANEVGAKIIVVHGGGSEIDEALKEKNITPQKIDGLRVTDEETLKIVVAVLDKKNEELVRSLQRVNVNAVPYDSTSHIIKAVIKNERLGLVGEVICVDTRKVEEDLRNKRIPVVSPIGVLEDNSGQFLNVNGDKSAGALAAVSGSNLVLVTSVEGVLDPDGKLIREISDSRFKLMQQERSITDGMIPKLEAAFQVAGFGGRVTICWASNLLYAFSSDPRGTVFNIPK